jgi:hypothetical protein
MTEDEKTELLSELVRWLEQADAVFRLDGPLLVTVKQKDGTFRKKTLPPMNFFLESVRSGQKDMIFVFHFEELKDEFSDYACIEVTAKEIDAAFPLLFDSAALWARGRFVSRGQSREAAFDGVADFRALLNMVFNFAKHDRKIEDQESADTLMNLPHFGMF